MRAFSLRGRQSLPFILVAATTRWLSSSRAGAVRKARSPGHSAMPSEEVRGKLPSRGSLAKLQANFRADLEKMLAENARHHASFQLKMNDEEDQLKARIHATKTAVKLAYSSSDSKPKDEDRAAYESLWPSLVTQQARPGDRRGSAGPEALLTT